MDLTPILEKHHTLAPILIFVGALLAGLNIPISIDLLLVFCIYVFGFVSQKLGIILFSALMLGCIASSHLAYGMGRAFGPKLSKAPFLRFFLSPSKLAKVQSFYKNHGNWVFFVARFIPFGFRNAVFYSSGMSKVPISRFFLLESAACLVWGITIFSLFSKLCSSRESLTAALKYVNILIFIAFSVTVIGFIWYKVKKRATKR